MDDQIKLKLDGLKHYSVKVDEEVGKNRISPVKVHPSTNETRTHTHRLHTPFLLASRRMLTSEWATVSNNG